MYKNLIGDSEKFGSAKMFRGQIELGNTALNQIFRHFLSHESMKRQ
jgi:hypothetical protein